MQPVAQPSPDYAPGPEHLPSPDYVPVPEHPPSPVEIPYVPEPEYSEYIAPSDDKAPLEDQPLPVDASPIADYPTDGRDGDDEPSDDDDDDDDDDDTDFDPDEDPFEDEKEEEHLAPADSSAIPIVDLTRARKTVRHEPSMSASIKECITRHAALLSPPIHIPSLPLPFPSPLTTSPTDTGAPLGYRAAGIRTKALLPSTSRRTDIPEADMPPQKRACLTTLAPRFEVGESFAAGAARDRPDHRRTVMILDREAMYAREAWAGSEDRSSAIAAHVRTLEVHVAALIAQTSSLQTQLTTTLGRIEILEARDPEPQEGPTEAGSSY
nr:hypothetical protein [Tanacetum cinerariifolium]